MSNNNNSGAVSILEKLRNDQSSNNESSNLEKIINKKKEQKANINQNKDTIDNSINDIDSSEIYEINPFDITRWKYKDRPNTELGDIQGLAKTIKEIGQQVPCIVRVMNNNPKKYELIAGERRWKAVETLGIKLKCIIQDIDDRTAALIQAVENEKRTDLSDFAKGTSYAEQIKNGLIEQKDLTNILGISRLQVSRLLSFSKISHNIRNAIGDLTLVSARTCAEINRLSNKGDDYINAIISLADKIKEGKVGAQKLEKTVLKIIKKESDTEIQNNKKIQTNDGRHIFTWRLDNNKSPSIHFPKGISDLINSNKIDHEELTEEIKELLINKLSKI